MFRRNSERRTHRPTPPLPMPDDEATQEYSDWQNMLHRHLPPTQAPTVGPPNSYPPDGFRHSPGQHPWVPQRAAQNPALPALPPSYATPPVSSIPPVPNTYAPPVPPNTVDETDIGGLIHQSYASEPYQMHRVLEYYGNPQLKNILVVMGYQVHAAYPQGVLITENGPTTTRTLIPWHRVHALNFAPGDPIAIHN